LGLSITEITFCLSGPGLWAAVITDMIIPDIGSTGCMTASAAHQRAAPVPAGCLGAVMVFGKAVAGGAGGWGGQYFYRPEQNRTSGIAELGHIRFMDMETKELTVALLAVGKELTCEEFASLLAVGNARVNGPAPVIGTEHSTRLIALGYMADIQGRLRMTTPGRIRITAGQ
jgi:hypothetical protein